MILIRTGFPNHMDEERKRNVFIRSGDEVIVEFCRVEKGYYRFIDQAQEVQNGENPMFGGPPSNIEENISNGAVGYFATYSPVQLRAIAP